MNIIHFMSSYCHFSWKIWKHILTCKFRFYFSHEFLQLFPQHISKLNSWWDNDQTHYISLHQALCEPLLDKNQHWWGMVLIVWSWYPQCAVWNLSALKFYRKRYDTAVSCIEMQYWWHLWPKANITFSHK